MNNKGTKIAAVIVVPFVLFIAAAMVYESTTGEDLVTGEKTGVADGKGEEAEFAKITQSTNNQSQNCSGTAQCITGTVTSIIDGDTIKVDGQSIRFALASAPELKGYGGIDSRNFIETICPVGSDVIVDEDDGQIIGSFGRMVGMVTCNGVNLNSELLDADLGYLELRFCDSSEFVDMDWAQKHGC